MARYSKKSQDTVKEVMEEFKEGKLKSGRSGKKVTNRKQAVAIGLSEARKKGAKVPPSPDKQKTPRGEPFQRPLLASAERGAATLSRGCISAFTP